MKQRLKICTRLLLLVVYLAATAGAACVSLSCRCAQVRMASLHDGGSCRCACSEGRCLHAEGALSVSARCCCSHSHSTETDLYTLPDQTRDAGLRCCVVSLPASLAALCPCPAHCRALRRRPSVPPVPLVEDPCIVLSGLRAPPSRV